ncbi:MAG: hypothetical protein RLY86_535 [Pseudomonadota bacterium]|jgi:diguanylate cyclase (GGDEF)-like protein/PAS domain S-box-containing protein
MNETKAISILLVEDDAADAGLVLRALRAGGHRGRCHHARSLGEALEGLAAQPADVVLLDLSLPDSLGLETVRRMLGQHPDLPLVVLTGTQDEDLAVASMAAGAQDYLFKGEMTGETLRRSIRYAIARMAMEQRIHRSERRLTSVISLARDAIIAADGQARITLVNPAAVRMFGHTEEAMLGRGLSLLLPDLGAPKAGQTELTGRRADGSAFPVEVAIACETGPEGPVLTAVLRDVTERRAFEAQLRTLASTDPLTDLPNRRHFLDQAERELMRMRRNGEPVAILMLDIDHFKRINDSYGHAAGDAVLRSVAAACRTALRATDLIGRIGGEEFGIVLPATGPRAAVEAAERLRGAMEQVPLPQAAGNRHLTVSIGVTACTGTDTGVEQALIRADSALYRAKAGGRDRVEVDPPARPSLDRRGAGPAALSAVMGPEG